ncbi:MAG: sugar ABC transporter ATP-binding protein, partial [Verrucomicrobiaceae bacterium]|nr:sugar ABC transporter ATP-binding protein [Verrucomicrobiaceae bacterium]
AGELHREEIEHDAMVSLMVGRELKRNSHERKNRESLTEGLSITNLRTATYPDCELSLQVRGGEILGMAGLVGAGRSELAQTVFGVDPSLGGSITLEGVPVQLGSARESIRAGIYLAPEDRKRTGLILEFDISQNISLASLKDHSSGLALINRSSERKEAEQQVNALKIKTPSTETAAMNLSGGNQQKVVLGKWLSMNPKVIIFDEPTRGIDVGAKAEIYKLMRALAVEGVAIWMISSDMEEVLGISDRILVMHEGRITGELEHEAFSEEAVMHLAVGGRKDDAA